LGYAVAVTQIRGGELGPLKLGVISFLLQFREEKKCQEMNIFILYIH